MTLAQLLPQARFGSSRPAAGAQNVAKRAAIPRRRFDLEIAGVVENMSGFTVEAASASRFLWEGGGQLLADELDVLLLAKVPLQEELRVCADRGSPLVLEDPDLPAAQALRHAARGLIAVTPQDLAVMQAPSARRCPRSRAQRFRCPLTRVARRAKALRADSGPVGRLRIPCL